MVIELSPELEIALSQMASRLSVAPEALVLDILQKRVLADATLQPRDEWERRLMSAASDCGVSLSNLAVSSEGLYD